MKTYNFIYDKDSIINFVQNTKANSFCGDILIQLFSHITNESYIKTIIYDIKSILPNATIIGATTSGEILDGKIITNHTILSISLFEKTKISSTTIKFDGSSFECGKKLATNLSKSNTKAFICFSDSFYINNDELLDGFSTVNTNIPISGGIASDYSNFQKGFVFLNDFISDCGAVGVSLNSDSLIVDTCYSFDWQPIGKILKITKADKNIVYEIDNQKAYDVFVHYLGEDVASLMPSSSVEFPIILKRDGIIFSRTVLKIGANQELIFSGNLFDGDEMQFGYGNVESILKSSNQIKLKLEKLPIESIFIYSCIARRKFMPRAIETETLPLQSIAPVSGFFTYGEFVMVNNKNYLANQSLSLITLSETNDIKSRYISSFCSLDTYPHLNTLKALSHLIDTTTKELNELNSNLDLVVKERTKQLENEKLRADMANRAKSDFLANMSHEIRTPMNSVLGFAELLDKKLDNPKLKSYVNSIRFAGKTLLQIINDILDLSKIESGKLQVQFDIVNIKSMFQDLKQLFILKVEQKDLGYRFVIDEAIPEFLMLDELRLRQIIINLLNNAIKFTDNGQIGLFATVLSINGNRCDLQITITDTGIGIPQDELQKIFEPFEQTDGQSTRKYGGTGLGLSISKNLINLMNGDIKVESNLGIGSKFIIELYDIVIHENSIDKSNTNDIIQDICSIKQMDIKDMDIQKAKKTYKALEDINSIYENVMKYKEFDTIKEFAQKLLDISSEYDCQFIKDYAINLSIQTANFDIEKIDKTLDSYKNLINKIKSVVD